MIYKKEKDFSIYVGPIKNIKPFKECLNIETIHYFLTSDFLKNYIKKNSYKKKHELYSYATFSGTFTERKESGLIEHSNLMTVDIDNYDGNLDELKQRICKLACVALCFISPSSKGLKVIMGIDMSQTTHEEYFYMIESLFLQKLDITIDTSGKDISRACFLCYDANAYFNKEFKCLEPSDFESLEPIERPITPKLPVVTNSTKLDFVLDDDVMKVKDCIDQLLEQDIDITEHYEDWLKICFALTTLGEEGRELFQKVSCLHPDYDESECDEKFTECLKSSNGSVSIGTFFHYCKQYDVFYHTSNVINTTQDLIPIRNAIERLEDAKNAPDLIPLFGDIWFFPEIHILFADTGVGKSILAVQLADAISKGNSILGLENRNSPQTVWYIDFELSDKMFEKRYINEETKELHEFSRNLLIDNLDYSKLYNNDTPKLIQNIDQLLIEHIKKAIRQRNIKVVFIDNITFLKDDSTQDGNVALKLMKQLKSIQKEFDIAICVIAHTPKRDLFKQITVNDLGGSKNLSNFADSISAIGKSNKGEDIRYIKQIKVRNGIEKYHGGNVIEMALEKIDSFLGFDFIDCNNEMGHLSTDAKEKRNAKKEKALELKRDGKSNRQIAIELEVAHSTINRWLK